MNLSYSTDILQHKACRVWAAEQLVLMRVTPEMGYYRGSHEFYPAVWEIKLFLCKTCYYTKKQSCLIILLKWMHIALKKKQILPLCICSVTSSPSVKMYVWRWRYIVSTHKYNRWEQSSWIIWLLLKTTDNKLVSGCIHKPDTRTSLYAEGLDFIYLLQWKWVDHVNLSVHMYILPHINILNCCHVTFGTDQNNWWLKLV